MEAKGFRNRKGGPANSGAVTRLRNKNNEMVETGVGMLCQSAARACTSWCCAAGSAKAMQGEGEDEDAMLCCGKLPTAMQWTTDGYLAVSSLDWILGELGRLE